MGILRFIFALTVLLAHALDTGTFLFPAPSAVISFFVISGFYMALILDGKYTSKIHFYINRALRIFPIYWLMLFLTVALGLAKSYFNIGSGDNAILHYFHYSAHLSGIEELTEGTNFVLRNLTLILSKDYFSITENLAGGYLFLYQAWSLQIELLFYFLAPFILRTNKNFLFFTALYFILFYGLIEPLTYSISPNVQSLRFLNYFIYFLLGVCSYKYIYLKIQHIKPTFITKILFLMFLGYLLFYQLVPGRIVEQDFYTGLLYYIPFAVAISFFFLLTKNSKWDRFIGELSYPIYMSHFVVAKIIYSLPHSNLPLLNAAIITALTIAFSLILIVLIQNPIDKFRHGKLKKN